MDLSLITQIKRVLSEMEIDAQKAKVLSSSLSPAELEFYADAIRNVIDQYINNFADDMDRTIEE